MLIRIAAVLIVLTTLVILWLHAQTDGIGNVYFLLPDLAACAALIAAAIHGGRGALIAAFALAAGVFMTATLGPLWTEGLAATPPGAAIALGSCLVAVTVLLQRKAGA